MGLPFLLKRLRDGKTWKKAPINCSKRNKCTTVCWLPPKYINSTKQVLPFCPSPVVVVCSMVPRANNFQEEKGCYDYYELRFWACSPPRITQDGELWEDDPTNICFLLNKEWKSRTILQKLTIHWTEERLREILLQRHSSSSYECAVGDTASQPQHYGSYLLPIRKKAYSAEGTFYATFVKRWRGTTRTDPYFHL